MDVEKILDKLTSRKFWVLIAYATVALVGDELGLDVDPDTLKNLTYGVMLYLGGQSFVDAGGLGFLKKE